MTANGGADPGGKHDPKQNQNHNLKEHGSSYHLVYSFGATLLFCIADFVFLWPENHLLALVFFAPALSLLAVYELSITYHVRRKYVAFVVGVIVAACGLTYLKVGPNLPVETEAHGWLLPDNLPTPPNGCTNGPVPVPADALLFIAGGTGVWTESKDKSRVLNVGNSTLLYVERNGDRLAFDADIYNETGNLMVRIIKNEFHLIAGEYSYQERSKNRSELAVYDKKGQKILYIYYANPNTVLVQGYFTSPDGTRVLIDDHKITILDVNNVIENGCEGGGLENRSGIFISKTRMTF